MPMSPCPLQMFSCRVDSCCRRALPNSSEPRCHRPPEHVWLSVSPTTLARRLVSYECDTTSQESQTLQTPALLKMPTYYRACCLCVYAPRTPYDPSTPLRNLAYSSSRGNPRLGGYLYCCADPKQTLNICRRFAALRCPIVHTLSSRYDTNRVLVYIENR